MGAPTQKFAGLRFGRLLVKSKVSQSGKSQWLCTCDCGKQAVVSGSQLKSGRTKSCGCLKSEAARRTWLGANLLERARARIEKHSIPEPNSGCWLWTGSLNNKGYGHTGMGGKSKIASRLSFHAFRCDPGEFVVMHVCDNPCCVNPDHLRLGSQQENIKDCFSKGRGKPRGVVVPACQ